MKKIDRRIVIVGMMVIIVGLAYGIMKFLIAQKEAPPSFRSFESKRYVEVEVIDYDTIISPISETGRMASLSEINLSAEASGKIEQGDIQLKKGSSFKRGDVIFKIYSDETALALKARKSMFLNSLALLLPDISIDFKDYEKTFRSFFNDIDISSTLPEFPEITDEKLTIFLASKNILSEYYTIQKDELQLSRYVVRAPFNGTLTSVFMEVGGYTNTGGTVAKAIRTDALELEVPLQRTDARWVNIGDPVYVESEIRSITWDGTVIRKGEVVDENTQRQSVFVSVKNHRDAALLAGEYLWATFPGRPIKDVMEIPRNAVFNSDQVFIVKNGRLDKKNISIVKVNTNTLLFNGLQSGDTIVVQPLINVFEGTMVTTSLDKQPEFDRKPGQGRPQ